MDNGEELYVSKFEKKSERTRKLKMEMGKNSNNESKNKNNLYVKFINESVDEDMLKREFEVYGPVSSVKIQVENVQKGDKEYQVHRGFGYVS
jgi:polyadenylate-binding protein